MKAWGVNDCDRECGCVVFAETRGQARATGAAEIDAEFLEVEVRRAPAFDGLTPTELTPAAYLARGWWVWCSGCHSRRLFDHDMAEGAAVVEGGEVYCRRCRPAGALE